jgi:hypothetical protein
LGAGFGVAVGEVDGLAEGLWAGYSSGADAAGVEQPASSTAVRERVRRGSLGMVVLSSGRVAL